MTQVVVIRPGSTDYDEQDRIQGMLNVPLNARGVEEAARTAEELREIPIDTIYCGNGESPYGTAQAIAHALGIKLRKLDKLHNLNHGLWQGLQVDEVRRKHPRVYRQWCEAPLTVCPPGGETIAAAYERVRHALRPVLKRHAGEVFALVTPEPLASVARCYLGRIDLGRVWELRDAEPRWHLLDVVPEEASKTVES